MILNCINLLLFSKLGVIWSANVRRLHRSSFFRAKHTRNHKTSF